MQNKRLFFVLALILLFAGCKFVQFPKVEADYGWTKLADTPAPVGPGSSLVSFIDNSHNSHIYATRGENTTDFWSYNTDTNT
ncbi:MAG TPA: hypothetical protein VLT10_00440, partial [Verrucomicrobiae bacterium]|nr:hypothetical protein [Verrucomicrobiae bacterium]